MGVLALGRAAAHEQGLRPLDVLRDLDGVSRLIDLAFAEDIAKDGPGIRNELAMLSAASPLVWLLRNVSTEVRDSLDGFVWIEDGRVAGNTTLTRDHPHRPVWTIANVAVHPDYRRRGIARALMQASLDAVSRRGGGQVVLQVKAANKAANDLYYSLGFQFVDGVVTARLTGRPTQPLPLAKRVRRVAPDEWRKVYSLVTATRSPLAERIDPLHERDYAQTLTRRIGDALGDFWQQEERFWLAVEQGDGFAGALRVHLRRFGGDAMSVSISPDSRNLVEESLIQSGLAACGISGHSITAKVSSGDDTSQAILWQYGFNEVRHLHRLVCAV